MGSTLVWSTRLTIVHPPSDAEVEKAYQIVTKNVRFI